MIDPYDQDPFALGAGGEPLPPQPPNWQLVAAVVIGAGLLVFLAAVFAGYPYR